QRQLLGRAGLGSLHGAWHAEWSSVAGGARGAKHKAGETKCPSHARDKIRKKQAGARKAKEKILIQTKK
ncbi:MAG: hypothetical protein WCA15_01795, partial [Candidatus Acidiferrales bacterium]